MTDPRALISVLETVAWPLLLLNTCQNITIWPTDEISHTHDYLQKGKTMISMLRVFEVFLLPPQYMSRKCLSRSRLIKIMEGGVFRRLTIAYSLDTRPSCNFLSGSSSSFGINQIIGLFFVYGCGILLSLVVLIIENALPEYLAYKALRSSH